MRSQLRPESRQDAPSTPRSRSSSTNSNLTSPPPTSARSSGILALPFSPSPAPAYVAASSASESVHNAVNERPLSDEVGSVVFADAALAQINAFLDALLYNILANSRSSTLTRIKPAVDVVIKGALGQRAIASGERELEDLLGDGEDDDELDMEEKEQDGSTAWDLDFVFRRTRLRLMVYMSLATMDDDEEESHVQQNQLHSQNGEGRDNFSRMTGLVSWKALMFLTAVLEYLAEACLKDAGQFAFARASLSRPNEDNSTSGTASATNSSDDQLVITDADIRKLNLSPSLGRLWRSWKKVTATPGSSPRMSQQAWQNALAMRRTSLIAVTGDESLLQRRPVESPSVADESLPSVDLPRRPNSDQTPSRRPSPLHGPKRSRSFVRFPVAVATSGTRSWQGSWQSRTPAETAHEARPRHVRSSSLPPPRLSVFTMPTRTKADDVPMSAVDAVAHREAAIIGPSPNDHGLSNAVNDLQSADAATKATTLAESTSSGPAAPISLPRVVTPVETVEEEEPQRSLQEGIDVPKTDEKEETPAPSEAEASDPPVVTNMHHVKQVEDSPLPVVREEPVAIAPDMADVPAPPSAMVDEYDPYRADATAAVSKQPQVPLGPLANGKSTKLSGPKPAQTQKYTFEDSDDEHLSEKRNDMPESAELTAGAAGIAATTAAAAAAVELRKKDKPAPIRTTPKHVVETAPPLSTLESKQSGRHTEPELRPEIVSPLKMSPVHTSDYQTPTGALTATSSATADDRNQDVFVTPPRSPVQKASLEKASPPLGAGVQAQSKFSTSKDLSARTDGSVTPKAQKKANLSQSSGERFSAESASGKSEKDFNDMISGKDTVRRTLTPRDLTEIEKPDSSARRQEVVKSIVVPNGTVIMDDSVPPPIPGPYTAASSKIEPPAEATIVKNAKKPAPPPADEPYIPRSPSYTPSLSSKPSKSGLTARESRVPQPGSTAELAEFFRSTAPDKPPSNPKPFAPSTQSGAVASKPPVSQISTGSGSFGAKSSANSNRLSSFRGGRNERQGNDDLIAFLNEGPPGARVNKTQSMETTHSSINAGISPARRSASPISHAPSFNESINSRSNLIGSNRRGGSNTALAAAESPRSPAAAAAAAAGPPQNRPPANIPKTVGGAPVRKQRRIKDPYAIDLDDEDEEVDDILMGLPNKREEGMSMIDFLRSTEPPTREEAGVRAKSASNPALSSKEVAAARAAATASPSIPDFLKDPGRGPSRRSSRDSFGSAFRGEKTRRGSTKSGEGKPSRFSFFRSSKVAG